jgi:hypothetical protein
MWTRFWRKREKLRTDEICAAAELRQGQSFDGNSRAGPDKSAPLSGEERSGDAVDQTPGARSLIGNDQCGVVLFLFFDVDPIGIGGSNRLEPRLLRNKKQIGSKKEKWPATKTNLRCNLGYGNTMNPNFFLAFLDRTKITTNLRMIWWMLTE